MARGNSLKAAVEKTAKQLGGKVSETAKKRIGGPGRVQPHKHCRMCGITIPASSEERVCRQEDCINSAAKDDKVKKQLRIWMFIFMGFVLLPIISALLRSQGVI